MAIIFVLFLHSLDKSILKDTYSVCHIGQAVPIFFSVTFYLAFLSLKNREKMFQYWFSKERFVKLFRRIVVPVIVLTFFQLLYLIIIGDIDMIKRMLLLGGWGPGSYYVWEYLQIWILAPFLYMLLEKYENAGRGIILLLGICVLLNIGCSYFVHINRLYSILCIRHLFLAAIAYIWLNNDKYKSWALGVLGILSLIYLIYFRNVNLEPFVYYGEWNGQNYPIYFWSLIFIYMLLSVFRKIKDVRTIRLIEWCGINSWSIFLCQMFVIGFIPLSRFSTITRMNNPIIIQLLYCTFVFFISIVPISITEVVRNKFLRKKY